jgi:hypothetical protein
VYYRAEFPKDAVIPSFYRFWLLTLFLVLFGGLFVVVALTALTPG